jgi:hypothetical protein
VYIFQTRDMNLGLYCPCNLDSGNLCKPASKIFRTGAIHFPSQYLRKPSSALFSFLTLSSKISTLPEPSASLDFLLLYSTLYILPLLIIKLFSFLMSPYPAPTLKNLWNKLVCWEYSGYPPFSIFNQAISSSLLFPHTVFQSFNSPWAFCFSGLPLTLLYPIYTSPTYYIPLFIPYVSLPSTLPKLYPTSILFLPPSYSFVAHPPLPPLFKVCETN